MFSSVVVHRWGDGHTPPDLPPSDQTETEKSTQEIIIPQKEEKTTQRILKKTFNVSLE